MRADMVISCVLISMLLLLSERRPQLCRCRTSSASEGGWGGSGGDPLSVMGQGHTMGTLCKICWGCTAVGKGVALITVRMFTRVCHVCKLICSVTFPSHNHLRICISHPNKKKKSHKKERILPKIEWDFKGQNYRPVLVTSNAGHIFVFVIVSPLYQR